jgi:hypothetical protein
MALTVKRYLRAGLTVKRVDRYLRLGKPKSYLDREGLYLKVTAVMKGSYVYRYERKGQEHRMHLGTARALSLKSARKKAQAARELRGDGIDPLEAREKKRAAERHSITFKGAFEGYFDLRQKRWSAVHRQQFQSRIKQFVLPKIGKLPVSEIDPPVVLSVLKQPYKGTDLWHATPKSADRLAQWLAAILDWAKAGGYRSGDNPARWKDHLDKLLARLIRERAHERLASVV